MGLNILIVDDSATARGVLAKALRMTGLPIDAIHYGGNGFDAFAILRKNPVDLLLSDLNMPDMDGFELLERMKEEDLLDSIPVVIVSADADDSHLKRLVAMGVKGFLWKPFTPEEFNRLVADVLGLCHA
jgi:two-component system chemotaxis response regulator CheY